LSGNLLNNENWSDFRLNEGIITLKVIKIWKGEDYSKMC
jgi:hypothetical protein